MKKGDRWHNPAKRSTVWTVVGVGTSWNGRQNAVLRSDGGRRWADVTEAYLTSIGYEKIEDADS